MKNEAGIVDLLKFYLGKRLKYGIISHLIKNNFDFPQVVQENDLHIILNLRIYQKKG
ncbi:hypothetical protein ETSB_1110 [cyanobacterium endosymbiont of Epithemia turgida isolate EtSB Lake Yunoko]|nr:hypothetical protein ETSB_1110 [cyanobacterium endosymbiont of Epithemia turgida isolate EtSB Lake Yunoko]